MARRDTYCLFLLFLNLTVLLIEYNRYRSVLVLESHQPHRFTQDGSVHELTVSCLALPCHGGVYSGLGHQVWHWFNKSSSTRLLTAGQYEIYGYNSAAQLRLENDWWLWSKIVWCGLVIFLVALATF